MSFMSIFWGASFGPAEIRLLTAVFERAWHSIERSGDVGSDIDYWRSCLAMHILAIARNGESDLLKLTSAALRGYRQQRAREFAAAFKKLVHEAAADPFERREKKSARG